MLLYVALSCSIMSCDIYLEQLKLPVNATVLTAACQISYHSSSAFSQCARYNSVGVMQIETFVAVYIECI